MRIDGKIASVSTDFMGFADTATKISRINPDRIQEISCSKISTEELIALSRTVTWDDLMPIGSRFQKMVWKELFLLTHPETPGPKPAMPLVSYSDFAELCGKKAGVRAVAHAVGMNPIAVIIPCHLVVPKETTDKIEETEKQAESTLFGKDGLCLDPALDFGEYRLGKGLKKKLIFLISSNNM